MESRPIAPAPTRDFGQRALPIQAKLTEVPRPKDARGKEGARVYYHLQLFNDARYLLKPLSQISALQLLEF
jgi:hypothetical protein